MMDQLREHSESQLSKTVSVFVDHWLKITNQCSEGRTKLGAVMVTEVRYDIPNLNNQGFKFLGFNLTTFSAGQLFFPLVFQSANNWDKVVHEEGEISSCSRF